MKKALKFSIGFVIVMTAIMSICSLMETPFGDTVFMILGIVFVGLIGAGVIIFFVAIFALVFSATKQTIQAGEGIKEMIIRLVHNKGN